MLTALDLGKPAVPPSIWVLQLLEKLGGTQMTERRKKMPKKWRYRLGLPLLVALAVALTGLPGVAMAQDALGDPTSAVYGTDALSNTADPAGSVSNTPSGLDSRIGSLPFTGMDLMILAGVALALTGTGFALRRASMPRGPRT